MSNTIAGFGAKDFMHQGGSQRTEELRTAWIASSDATPIFNGDLTQQLGLVSTSAQTTGYGPYITQGCSATTTGGVAPVWTGIFRGCEYYNVSAGRMQYSRYWPGSGAAGTSSQTGDIKAFLSNDLSARYLIQASSDGVVGSSQVGQVFNCAVGGTVSGVSSTGGNTTTGDSAMQLYASGGVAIASTSTSAYAFKLMDFYSNWAPGLLPGQVPGSGTGQFVNGADNTSAGQWLIVQPNTPTWVG